MSLLYCRLSVSRCLFLKITLLSDAAWRRQCDREGKREAQKVAAREREVKSCSVFDITSVETIMIGLSPRLAV